MNNTEYYYIEIKRKPFDTDYCNVIIERKDVPPFIDNCSEKNYLEYVFEIYMAYCKTKDYYHYALRTKNGIWHGLISEFFSDMSVPFWYTTYPDYKTFASFLPFEPSERSI